MAGVHVVNSRHDGYRRAGFRFNKGENILPPVDFKQFKLLEADPDLVVTPIVEDDNTPLKNQDEKGQAGGQGVDTGQSVVPQPEQRLTKAELLATAVAEYRINPVKYQTQKGELSIKAFRAVVGDNVTLDDVKAEMGRTVD